MSNNVVLYLGTSCLLFLTVFCQDPNVRITETQPDSFSGVVECLRDQDVTLTCYVENKIDGMMVRWNRMFLAGSNGPAQVKKVSEDMSVEDNTKYSIEKPTAFSWRLRLKTIQVADEGEYVCFVYTTQQNRKEARIKVYVRVPPYFDLEHTSSDMTVKAGDNVDLVCNASAVPRPQIQWTRLGGALLPIGKETHFEPKLPLIHVRPEDRGTYRCQAANEINMERYLITRDVKLNVQFKPILRGAHDLVEQAPGYRIELQCIIESNPLPDFETGLRWVKGARTISVTTQGYTVKATRGAFNKMTYELILHNVRQSDYGEYKCRITNQEGYTEQTIRLAKSDTPMKSFKLGRVISGADQLQVCIMASLISALVTILLHMC